jgi:hypothetical protein
MLQKMKEIEIKMFTCQKYVRIKYENDKVWFGTGTKWYFSAI